MSLNAPEGIYDGRLSINGIAVQNQVLTAQNTFTEINASGRISYQWLASGYDIYGATSNTLTLAQSQVNKIISLKATYTDTKGVTKTILAMATDRVANVNDPVTGQFTISGTTTQHQTLTAVTSTLADLDGMGTISYQWLANGRAITSATGATLTLAQAQVGKAISVKASYTDGQNTVETVTSSHTAAVQNVNDAPVGCIIIGGLIKYDALVGHQLTAINSLADADGLGTFTYQWLADGVAIRGATAETFIPTVSQQEKAIRVKVQYTDGFGKKETVQSAVVATAQDAQYGDLIRVGSNDRLQGGIFTSDLYGYAGNDELSGDAGEDRLYGGYGDDSLYGGIGNDELEGDQGNDKLYGELGNDVLTGGTGRDSLYGGDGNDVLDGSSDRDFMDGGNGRDTYYVDNPGDVVRDSGTDNVKDVLYITAYLQSGYSLGEGIENAILSGEANASSLTGNASNNTLTGNTSENKLSGGVGIDTLNGGDGNDTLMGGEGKDVLNGGAGRDVFKLEKLIESGLDASTRDIVQSFERGQDKLGLSALDANTSVAGDQKFSAFISSTAVFTKAGQLQLKSGVLYGNTDADADAEFSIALTGITTLTMADVVA